MCGLLGFSSTRVLADELKTALRESLRVLDHRGPDGQGFFHDDHVWLGHNRLSIIDLSQAANQPLKSSSQDSYIIFNGEIYNYQEISEGLALQTKSDTEVLLQGYLKHGPEFLKRIRGMYAFSIYDQQEAKLYLYRDPAGIKPLYYHYNKEKGELIYASEIKAILPLLHSVEMNEDILKLYIHIGYCLEPETIYKNIFALTPGYLLTFDCKSGEMDMEGIKTYKFGQENNFDFAQNVKKTEEYLHIACRRNLVADVDVSIALSGGIDSSLILAFSQAHRKINCLTIKFDEDAYDESPIAKKYADHLKVSHQVISTHAEGKLNLINKLLLHFDQPYADSSFVPFYFLNREAFKHSKVIIGGDSGDEIQNGYSGYGFLPWLLRLGGSPFRYLAGLLLSVPMLLMGKRDLFRQLNKLRRIIFTRDRNEAIFEWNAWFPASRRNYLDYPFKYDASAIFKLFSNEQEVNNLGFIEENYFRKRMQSDYLRKADMMSMINSVEFRVPMLDEDLVSFSLSIPYILKSDLSVQKKIFRKIHRQIYPAETSALKKRGFSIPLDSWLGEENLSAIKKYISSDTGIVQNYVDVGYIDTLFLVLTSGDSVYRRYCSRASAYQRILILYSLQLWYFETFMKHKKIG